jgi:spermidine synthase
MHIFIREEMKKNKIEDQKVQHIPGVFISEFRGVRSLHLAQDKDADMSTAPIQGSMRLTAPDQIELDYVQQMMVWTLFENTPKHIVQLGLGAASLTKFCYQHFPSAKVTAVDLNPFVIEACRAQFFLPVDDERLTVLEMDAIDYLAQEKIQGSLDVLQVDLYDAKAEGPVFDSIEFYRSCANALNDHGMMTVNLFADSELRKKNVAAMEASFDVVVWLPEVHNANIVALAFKTAPVMEFTELDKRAVYVRVNHKLKAQDWVYGLKRWMTLEDDDL